MDSPNPEPRPHHDPVDQKPIRIFGAKIYPSAGLRNPLPLLRLSARDAWNELTPTRPQKIGTWVLIGLTCGVFLLQAVNWVVF